MAKKQRHQATSTKPAAQDQPSTLKDMLRSDVLEKLQAASKGLKDAEDQRKAEVREKAEVERKAEQKRLDNDFGHLLENSKLDWKKYKK
ncbi:YqkE family protein [Paenibacillus sp. N1-5-1-14]|uniref:YqkE family protein n=1 Tax=Paenibacillus radicibacter TaxID=2972488 RepID=UPI002159AF7B|nr:YqkE family protein [Paenibacillus radicibacter]MCR8641799.1 YqkE family protein [Paenibacillus radicibacter]